MIRRCRLLSTATLLVTFAFRSTLLAQSVPVTQSAGGDQPAAPSSIKQLIADLDSDRYAVRNRATRRLIAAGSKVVAPLSAAARHGTLEVQTRAIRILQEMFVGSDNNETIDDAELALESLEALAESSNRSLAARANRVLSANVQLIQQRALIQIVRLGGVINYSDNLFVNPNNPNLNRKQITYLQLGDKWRGGDDGLKFVRRLTRLRFLYLIGTAELLPISKEAQKELQATLPNLIIQHRGRAYLGIGGDVDAAECRVVTVQPGRAAAKAGLKPRDVITSFGGKKISDFKTLVGLLKTYKPGDKVKVELLRSAQTLTIEVVMGEWK